MLALWIGGSTMPVQCVENPDMLRWVLCLNSKVIFTLWCLPPAENAGCEWLYDSSYTLSFVRLHCRAERHSQGWLRRFLLKSGSCWRENCCQRGESPSPRTRGPASCVTTRTWVCLNVFSSTWLCSTFLLVGVTAHIYNPEEGKRMSLKLSKYERPPLLQPQLMSFSMQ